jgi:methanogenic corrinoid protein MtbC1
MKDVNTIENDYKEFLSCLLEANKQRCSEIAHNYLANNHSIVELYEYILKKALYEIGQLWEDNIITVASEHIASALVDSILNELYIDIISLNKVGKSVVCTCVPNEYHRIGIKMISDVFELNGWNSYLTASNTTLEELNDVLIKLNPNALVVSLSIFSHLPALENMLNSLNDDFPDLTILVGGQAFLHGGKEVLVNYKNVYYQADIYEIEQFIETQTNE